jgi:hypothetical protein
LGMEEKPPWFLGSDMGFSIIQRTGHSKVVSNQLGTRCSCL